MVFEEIENHIAKMEAEVTAIRARQERIRELTSESLAADALCELIDSV